MNDLELNICDFEGTFSFQCAGRSYKASFSPKEFEVFSGRDVIASYNCLSGETKWFIRHSCGLQGFGMDLDDVCYACKQGEEHTLSENNKIHLRINGGYTPELNVVIPLLARRFVR